MLALLANVEILRQKMITHAQRALVFDKRFKSLQKLPDKVSLLSADHNIAIEKLASDNTVSRLRLYFRTSVCGLALLVSSRCLI